MRTSYVKNEYPLQSTEGPQLASQKDADCEIIHDFIRPADNLPRPPSLAGVALLRDLAPPTDGHGAVIQQHDNLSYSSMSSTNVPLRQLFGLDYPGNDRTGLRSVCFHGAAGKQTHIE